MAQTWSLAFAFALSLSLSHALQLQLQLRPPQLRSTRCRVACCSEEDEAAAAAAAAEAEGDGENDFSRAIKKVPMSTPLGFDEFPTTPGPPVPTLAEPKPDGRDLYTVVGMYADGLMPSSPLQDRYVEWLEGSSGLCTARYLNKEQSIDDVSELGVVVTEDEMAALDAAEETPEEEGMIKLCAQFVLGHLNIVKASARKEAEAWAHADPQAQLGGYTSLAVHRWRKSADPELTMEAPGLTFAAYCLDKPGGAALRAKTRDAHLAWLREGGRVQMAGPLHSGSPDGEGEAGDVGTLLVVNGDELSEVRRWAASDPFAKAGLFASVTVAPLTAYAVDQVEEFW